MPNVASIAALPAHASPAPKEKESARGKPSAVRPDFARLFREKASPLQSRIGSIIPFGATNPMSRLDVGKPTGESGVVTIPAADQDEAVPKQASPDTALSAEVKQSMGAPHAGMSNRFPKLSGGKDMHASETGITDSAPPVGMKADKAEGASSLSLEASTTAGGEKIQSTRSDSKTKATAPLPNPEQMRLTALLPLLPVSSAAGIASVPSGNGAESIDQKKSPQGARNSEGKIGQLRMSGYRLPAAPSAAQSPDNSEVGQVKPSDDGTEFDISTVNGSEMVVNSVDHSDSGSLYAHATPLAVHADPRKLMAETGATGAPPITFTAHVATEAVVAGGQHVGVASSPTVSAIGATVNSAASPTPYDRIDQGAAPVVLHSGAQHVSVGVQDPDLGWVEIQTQGAAGHVDATLITASGQAHAALAAQLPAMAQYLEQRDVRVGALVVQHHATGGGGVGSGGPGYGSANTGAGAHHSNPGNSGGDRTPPRYAGHAPGNLPSVTAINSGVRPGEEGAVLRAVSYISVRA